MFYRIKTDSDIMNFRIVFDGIAGILIELNGHRNNHELSAK